MLAGLLSTILKTLRRASTSSSSSRGSQCRVSFFLGQSRLQGRSQMQQILQSLQSINQFWINRWSASRAYQTHPNYHQVHPALLSRKLRFLGLQALQRHQFLHLRSLVVKNIFQVKTNFPQLLQALQLIRAPKQCLVVGAAESRLLTSSKSSQSWNSKQTRWLGKTMIQKEIPQRGQKVKLWKLTKSEQGQGWWANPHREWIRWARPSSS